METKKYLLEIYKVEADKYNKTRDIQWKINIAIWTVLVVMMYAKLEQKIKNIPPFIQGIIFFIFAFAHFIFIRKIHGSLDRSLTRMHNMASHLLEQDENVEVKWKDFEKEIKNKKGTWEYWQLGITGFLIWIFFALEKSD